MPLSDQLPCAWKLHMFCLISSDLKKFIGSQKISSDLKKVHRDTIGNADIVGDVDIANNIHIVGNAGIVQVCLNF